jgi:hypothetical protein
MDLADTFHALRVHDLRELEHRLREGLKRDASGSVTVDGFPRSTGSGTGSSSDVSRPTENAVLSTFRPARAGQDPGGPMVQRLPRDPVREDVENAWAYVQQALHSLEACTARLDHLESVTGKPRDPEVCASCLRVGVFTPMEHFGDVGGKLPQPFRLCVPCYDWVRKHEGGFPTQAYLERRHQVGARGRARVVRRAG